MAAQRRGAGRSRDTTRRASYHGSSAGVGRLLHAVVRPARRSPLAGGTRDRYAPLSKADTGTLVDALVTPSTRQHTIETTRAETLTVHPNAGLVTRLERP